MLLVLACGRGDEPRGVSRVREVDAARTKVMTSDERFGAEPVATPTPAAPNTAYEYKLPAGWTAAKPRRMRELNFRIDGEPDIECFAMTLRGRAGGIRANVNRWCRQMSVAPIAPADLDRCEKFPMLGSTGLVLELRGTYLGMGQVKHHGWGLIGVICPQEDRTVFVKMTGPADAIAAQRESLVQFCKSLRAGT